MTISTKIRNGTILDAIKNENIKMNIQVCLLGSIKSKTTPVEINFKTYRSEAFRVKLKA